MLRDPLVKTLVVIPLRVHRIRFAYASHPNGRGDANYAKRKKRMGWRKPPPHSFFPTNYEIGSESCLYLGLGLMPRTQDRTKQDKVDKMVACFKHPGF